jgi:hypothetical protein
MKRFTHIMAGLALGAALNAQGQSGEPEVSFQMPPKERNTIHVGINEACLEKKTLTLDMDVTINYTYVGRGESLYLTLMLESADGRQALALPPIIINGTKKRQIYERAVVLKGEQAANDGAYTVLKCDDELIQFVPYRITIAYRSWMRNAQLALLGEVKDYGNRTTQTFNNMIREKLPLHKAR